LYFADNTPELRIDTPTGKLDARVLAFAQEKASWILKYMEVHQAMLDKQKEFDDKLEKEVLFLGEYLPIAYRVSDRRRIVKEGKTLCIYAPEKLLKGDKKKVVYAALRELAKAYLRKKIQHWSNATSTEFHQLRIKDLKSKWGSCSSLRNINLNWRLIFLPEPLIDYVVIHELMHLREMNHSSRFWNWVEKFFPSYKKAKIALKEYQWIIGILR